MILVDTCRDIKHRIDDLTKNVPGMRRGYLEPFEMSKNELEELVGLQKLLMVHKCNCLEKVV